MTDSGEPRTFTRALRPPYGERIDLYDPHGYRIVWTGKRWYDPRDGDGSLQTQEAWPPDGDGPWFDRPRIDVRKISYYMPLANGRCGGCDKPILYNLVIGHLEHEEPNPDCPTPWVKVERTPEEEARILAAEAKAWADDRAARVRHTWILTNAPHPILQELVAAHGPDSDGLYPDCTECPRPPSEFDGNPVPEAWPCPTWTFISDRMDDQ